MTDLQTQVVNYIRETPLENQAHLWAWRREDTFCILGRIYQCLNGPWSKESPNYPEGAKHLYPEAGYEYLQNNLELSKEFQLRLSYAWEFREKSFLECADLLEQYFTTGKTPTSIE